MSQEIVKVLDHGKLIGALDTILNPIIDSKAEEIAKTFPVYNMVLNNSEVTDDFLRTITMEQLELALDAAMYASTMDEDQDSLTPEDYRNPMFEYCHVRDWLSEMERMHQVKPQVTFF